MWTTPQRLDPRLYRARLLLGAAVALCLLLGACRDPPAGAERWCAGVSPPAIELPVLDLEDPGISRGNLRAWVEMLTDPDLRGRHAGEPGADVVAGLLAAQMARYGLEPPRPGEGFCQDFSFLDAEDYNVVGRLPEAPREGGRAILISAHYDGQGTHPAGMIYPGADDNASGVAALLEVARLAARQAGNARLDDRSVAWTFAAFGAEEAGRQGVRSYLAEPAFAGSGFELAINLDMVGRPYGGDSGDAIGYLVLGASPASTRDRLRAAARSEGIELRSLEGAGDLRPSVSDAQELASHLPTLLLTTALHEDHHELSDTPDRIDYGQIERAARLVLELASPRRGADGMSPQRGADGI